MAGGVAATRIASFNVENMFLRANALNQDTWAEGRPALERDAKVNSLLNNVSYSASDKTEIAKLLTERELSTRATKAAGSSVSVGTEAHV